LHFPVRSNHFKKNLLKEIAFARMKNQLDASWRVSAGKKNINVRLYEFG